MQKRMPSTLITGCRLDSVGSCCQLEYFCSRVFAKQAHVWIIREWLAVDGERVDTRRRQRQTRRGIGGDGNGPIDIGTLHNPG